MNKTYVHELKCWPEFYRASERGDKMFEIRKEDRERKFSVGDILHLREFEPCTRCEATGFDHFNKIDCTKCHGEKGQYTNSEILEYHVTYIMRGPQFGLQEGWVIMSLGMIFDEGDL